MQSRLGEILLDKKLITHEQLDLAMGEQRRTGELLGKVMIKRRFITEDDLLLALSEQLGISSVELKSIEITDEVIRSVPAKFVWHYKFIPFKLENDTLHIATAHPQNTHIIDELRVHLGYNIKTAYSSEIDVEEAVKKHYGIGGETVEEIMGKSEAQELKIKRPEERITDLGKMAEDASVIKLVNQFLRDAINNRATDIHIEPYRDKVRIRYRVDGMLYDTPVPGDIKYLLPAIISRIKIISGLDIVERRQPQDGRAKVKILNQEVDLRISVIPSINGENIVIRILPTQMLLNQGELGIAADDLELIEELIRKPYGILLLTGPTGSGKTTTLYASLSRLNSEKIKIITIEDPVEYELMGITQIQVNPKVNLTFANALRSILRHDPDVMMVGEIRDTETAELAIRVALTGHFVFTTLHTNDAASGVTRLIDMDIE
ncbi:MAG: GspE/PulE family protein, partial [Candidatus Omnitrophota bacterium]